MKKSHAKSGPATWYVWFDKDGAPKPMPGHVVLGAELTECAERRHSDRPLDQVVAEEEADEGTTWEIIARQAGVQIVFTIYV